MTAIRNEVRRPARARIADEFPGRSFKGTLVRNANAIDLASRTLLVEVDVDNPAASCCPGAYAFVHLQLPKQIASVAVPANTLLFRAEGPQVAVVRDGRAQIVPVTIGRDYGTTVEIVPVSSPPTRSSWRRRTRSSAAPGCGSPARRPEPGHEAARPRCARARRAPGRWLHGRPRLHQAVGADDGGLQGDGRLEDRAARATTCRAVRWWEIFGDPELHALEEQVAAANQNLKIAEARLREARAQVKFNRAALFPTISTGSAPRLRESSNRPFRSPGLSTGSSGDLLLSLDMSYEVDLWGRVRRTVAAAEQEAQATAADLETARLSLQAELASTTSSCGPPTPRSSSWTRR